MVTWGAGALQCVSVTHIIWFDMNSKMCVCCVACVLHGVCVCMLGVGGCA